MAESFDVPGQDCDVTVFDADKQQGWGRFCDCMFVREQPDPVSGYRQSCSDGTIITPELQVELMMQGSSPQAFCNARGTLLQSAPIPGGPVIRTKTPDWHKCASKHCLLPTGCWNPSKQASGVPDAQSWDPFNSHVGMFAAPWTDFGAVARGIPKRNPSVWYDVARATALDLNDFTPVNMWKLFWQNKGLWLIRVGQMQVLGIVFPLFGAAFNLSGFGSNPFTMIAALVAQVVAERRDVLQDVVLPMLFGTWSDIQVAFKLLFLGGPFAAFQPFAIGGIFVAKFARDQIDTGEAAKGSPQLQAVLHFLAATAERIGAEMQRTLTHVDVSMNNVTSIMGIVKSGFVEVANALPAGPTKDWVAAIVVVLRVAHAIVNGMEKGYPPDAVVDDVVHELFGFKLRGPGGLVESIQAGPAAVKALFASVADRGDLVNNIQDARARLDTVGAAFHNLVQVLSDLGRILGGGVQKFAKQFEQFLALFNDVSGRTNVDTTLTLAGTPPPVIPSSPPGSPPGTTPPVTPKPPLSVIGIKPPVTVTKPSVGAGAVVGATAGAAAGALVFGVGAVPGALVGGAAGALLALARGAPAQPKAPRSPKPNFEMGLGWTAPQLGRTEVPFGIFLPPLPNRWKPK